MPKKAAKIEKKVQKIVEDKTFGLKNKNKSKKVQRFIEQVNNQAKHGGGKQSKAFHEKQSAVKKAEKEARKQAELEMFKLLGDAYKPKQKSKKTKKKEEEENKKKKEEAEQKRKEQIARDFAIPIVALKDVFQLEAKVEVKRVCAVMTHKDNLASKNFNGQPCLVIKISDGSTLNPFTVMLNEETPTSFDKKVGAVLDIRGSIAMVRGEKVVLESVKGQTTLIEAGPELSDHVVKLKEEHEEIRAQGGIPIEQLIEEQRAKLESANLTPVTKDSFYAWKEQKRLKREEEAEQKKSKEEKKTGKSVKNMNVLTGRQLFVVDKSLFKDDDNAWDESKYTEEQPAEAVEKVDHQPGTGAAVVTDDGAAIDTTDFKDKLRIEEEDKELFLDDVDDLDFED